MVAALQAVGLVDEAGVILEDPRYSRLPWRAALAEAVPELADAADRLVPDASHVSGEGPPCCACSPERIHSRSGRDSLPAVAARAVPPAASCTAGGAPSALPASLFMS